MKAKLLAIIVVAVAMVPFGLPSSGQFWPSRSPMISACQEANSLIPELIELAPFGTGWVNRTKASIEALLDSIFQRRGELSQVGRAVIAVDIKHTFLYFDLRTIMKASPSEVEEMMPSKLNPPVLYIHVRYKLRCPLLGVKRTLVGSSQNVRS